MNDIQTQPLKIYIQDIFRAKCTENKYVYEMFGLKFKNIMINGVVTAVYNKTSKTTNLELSDPTGSVQIYYDRTKSKNTLPENCLKDLYHHFAKASQCGDVNINVLSMLTDKIKEKKDFDFTEGSYLNVIGDIFLDDKNCRMISAYECKVNSIERDIIWLEELRYMYEKFYLWEKENKS